MKYHTAQLLALATVASAFPHPQLPAFSMPSFSLPAGGTATGTGTGLGSGAGLPSIPSGTGLGSGTGFGSGTGLGSGTGIPSIPSGTGLGSGTGTGTGLGSGFGMPSFPSAGGATTGTGGSSLTDMFGGLGGGGAAAPAPAASTTAGASAPASTGGAGTIGTNCKAQTAGSSTENGIKDKNCCTDMTIIFARGTGEMGNMGSVSGPPMVKAIRSKLGANRVTVQGVDYAASAAGNANQGADGGQTMATLVKTAKSQCPNTKIIVSGYSQGAMVVHNALTKGVAAGDVSGAVLFGDPMKTQAISGLAKDKVKEFCGTSDQICGGGGDGGATGSHISYGSSADAAATFAIQAAGLA